ncbi:MAG TPA: pilus assembly protein TadG-related protein [Spirochaetia bacterium]|nr:pilus assembly protein TadG-related protein [Spirochaetia bacterium]
MIRKEDGQSLVFVALLVVLLFGFSAVGVDIGAEVTHGVQLQKAATAAALAAASNSSNAQSAAEAVLQANNISQADYDTDNWFTINGGKYTVSISEPHHFFFAPVLGFKTPLALTRSATADSSGYYPLSGYAIFNGSTTQALQLGGCGVVTVNGNVHSNSDIDFGSTGGVNITGNVTLDGNIVNATDGNITGTTINNSYISLPDYSSFLAGLKTEANNNKTYYSGDQTFGGDGSDVLTGPIYVDGSVTLENNGSIQQNTCIYASGGITIESNGSIGTTGSDGGVSFALYSGGNITFENNGALTMEGFIYAPNGSVDSTNNGAVSVYGAIVGQNVNLDNHGSPIVQYLPFDSGFQYYPQTQIAHLVE